MFAAIPYFQLPVWNPHIPGIGSVPVDPWATLVCLGFVLGLEISRHRAIKLGLDVRDIVDGSVFTVAMGFVFGHVITVVAYYPERLREQGIWSLLKLWEGFSSFGGFLGAVIGSVLFYLVIRKRDYLRHADVITYGFPFGWVFGRLGCGVVHDHVGKKTSFPLGMDFDDGVGVKPARIDALVAKVEQTISNEAARKPVVDTISKAYDVAGKADPLQFGKFEREVEGVLEDGAIDSKEAKLVSREYTEYVPDPAPWADGVRYELGLTEAGYMLLVCAVFFYFGRKDRVPGFFLGLYAVLYAPVRFGLDFLRNTDLSNQDARYLGLTPAQYGSLLMLALGVWILATRNWKSFRPWAMDGSADQGAVASNPPAQTS